MPRLTDLEAKFIRHERRVEDGQERTYFVPVETIGKAQGVMFLCPKCFTDNGGAAGTHSVICWSRSRGVPDDLQPAPGRWTLNGSSIDDLTLNGDPPGQARSVLLTGPGCGWHGFVDNGSAA